MGRKANDTCTSTSVASRAVPLYWSLVRPNLESWGQFGPLTTRMMLRGWSMSREKNRAGEGAGANGGIGVAQCGEKEA